MDNRASSVIFSGREGEGSFEGDGVGDAGAWARREFRFRGRRMRISLRSVGNARLSRFSSVTVSDTY
eukprot:1353431-Amorphochlora_amoeboformis.AAC.1